MYNVGIVGYGASAKVFHIPLIENVPELNFYAVVQRHPISNNDASKDHPNVKRYAAAEDMVNDSAVHLVVVTTPPITHFDLAKLALGNGKHVVVEKPFVPTSKEAAQLIDLTKKNKRLLTVYQSKPQILPALPYLTRPRAHSYKLKDRRWDSDFLTLRSLLSNNALGRIVDFESHFDRYKPSLAGAKAWKTRSEPGGGAIYDLGAHLIDQIYVLFGSPKKITAFLGSQRAENPGGYEDACTVLLHYDGGMTATVRVSVISPETVQLRFWVRGEQGSYKKSHEDIQETHLTKGMAPGDQGFGVEPDDWHGTLTTVDDDGNLNARTYPTIHTATYKTFYTQLAQAIAGKGEVPVKPEDAREVVRLIELAKQSSDEGRTIEV
ncbi:MAG: hypothetical protein LQ350_007492 [Teloschistes chrysophthalmus]|nr:MAG: hypothetical protein LQ350_007492 [Niorma chrysophthalma]